MSVIGISEVRHRLTHKDGDTVCNSQGVRQLLGTYKPLGWLISIVNLNGIGITHEIPLWVWV